MATTNANAAVDMSDFVDDEKIAMEEEKAKKEAKEVKKDDVKCEESNKTSEKKTKKTSGKLPTCKQLFKNAKWHYSQDEAYSDMINNYHEHVIKFTDKQFSSIPTIKDFINKVFYSEHEESIPKHFHELLLENKPIKLFADLDLGEWDIKKKEKKTKYGRDNIITQFISLMEVAFKNILNEKFDITNCYWTTASKKTKLSIHFVYDGHYFANRKEQHLFWEAVRELYLCDINYEFDFDGNSEKKNLMMAEGAKKWYEPLDECIDFNCYNRSHSLRTVYSTKIDDKKRVLNPFTLESEEEELEEENEHGDNYVNVSYTVDEFFDYDDNKIEKPEDLAKYFIGIDRYGFEEYRRLRINMDLIIIDKIIKRYQEAEESKRLNKIKNNAYDGKNIINKRTLEQINFILEHVAEERSDKYEFWRLAMYAIKFYANALGLYNEGNKIAHDFSARSRKYDKYKVEIFYDNITNSAPSQVKIGSLIKWLQEDNTTKYKEMLEEFREKPIDISDIKIDQEENYLYIDFVREFENKKFSSRKELIDSIRAKAPKVLARLLTGEGSYIKKDDNDKKLYSMINKNGLKKSFKVIYCEEKIKKIKKNDADDSEDEKTIIEIEKTLKFEDIVDECVNMYKNTDVMPNKDSADKDIFNLWRGFAAKMVEDAKYDEAKVKLFIDFIKEVVCNNNEEHCDIILNWLSAMVQNPTKRIPIYLLMVGGQGIGKSTFSEFIRKYIIGYRISSTQATIDDALGQWNGWAESCVLDIIEELPTLKNGGDDRFNKFKEMVSGETLRINNKNINPYEVKNLLHIIINTNHKYSMACEGDDRRCFALEINNKYQITDDDKINNATKYNECVKYWNNIHQNFSNQEFGNMFFTYLMKFNINYDKLKKAPITNLKQEIIDSNKCNAVVYVEELKQFIKHIYSIGCYDENGEYKFNAEYKSEDKDDDDKLIDKANRNKFWDSEKKTGKIYTSTSDLYADYVKWCEPKREKAMSQTWFFRNIGNLLIKHKKNIGVIYYL